MNYVIHKNIILAIDCKKANTLLYYLVCLLQKSNIFFSHFLELCRNQQSTPIQFVQLSQQNTNRLTCKTQVRRSFIFTFTMLNQSVTPYNTEPVRSTAHCISCPISVIPHVYLLQQALPCQTRQFCRRKYSLKVCEKYR